MHKKETNQKVLFAGILIVVLVALVIVLFSLGPSERAFVGQAAFTPQQVVITSSSADNPEAILAGGTGYALLKNPAANDGTQPPAGSFICPDGFGFDSVRTVCTLGSLPEITGWLVIQLRNPVPLEGIRLTVGNFGDGANVANTDPATVQVFLSPTPGVWYLKGQVSPAHGVQQMTSTFDGGLGLVQAILIGRSNRGPNAPDPRVLSLDITYGCGTLGQNQVGTINGLTGICRNGIFVTDLSCTQEGQTVGGQLYCDGTRWISEGQQIRTSTVNADGTPTTFIPLTGFCPNANDCVSARIGGSDLFCYDNREIYQGLVRICLAGSWHICNQEGVIPPNSNSICLNLGTVAAPRWEWQQNLNCAREDEVRGQAICRGRTWRACNSIPDVACVGTTTPEICTTAKNGEVLSAVTKYYCSAPPAISGQTVSSPRWVECNEQRLGEGVDNRPLTTSGIVYNNRFVCSKTGTTYNWVSIDCNSCAGAAPGYCTGSSIFDLRTNAVQPAQSYHASQRYPIQVGCTLQQNGCFYRWDTDQNTPDYRAYDEEVVDSTTTKRYICGNNNHWLECPSLPGLTPPFYSSDGLQWICDSSQGLWEQCTLALSESPNRQRGNFECRNVAGKYEWFSVFACNARAKYALRGGQICNGERFVNCNDIANDPALNNDAGVSITCENGQIVKKELACLDTNDNDNDGLIDCRDVLDCAGIQPITLHEHADFMVKLSSNMCSGLTYDISTNLGRTSYNSYRELNICSTDNRQFLDSIQVCSPSTTTREVTIPSVELLERSNNRLEINPSLSPAQRPERNVVFIYEQPTGSNPKEVRIILTMDITQQAANFNLNNFVKNTLAGQGVVLKLDSEYYLLVYPTTRATFSMQNLELRHIPLKTRYTAQPYAGTTSFVFNVLGQRQIVVSQQGGFIVISSVRPSEAPAAYVLPFNLTQQYEITVTKTTPVRIASPSLGVLSICRGDNDRDIRQVLLCLENTPLGVLKVGNLTAMTLLPNTGATTITAPPGGLFFSSPSPGVSAFSARVESGLRSSVSVILSQPSTEPIDTQYALLYQYDQQTNQKKVSLFKLARPDNLPGDDVPKDLNYNDFINNMIEGRRLGITHGEQLYLLRHGQNATTLSLPTLSLNRYVDNQLTSFPAIGSEDLVDFSILGGNRVTVQRRYGLPPPPFQLSGLTRAEVLNQPVDLNREFSAVMSSEGPISLRSGRIINYGVIEQSTEDLVSLQGEFLLSSTIPNRLADQRFQRLVFRQPVRRDNEVLFYYHSAQALGTIQDPRWLKTVAIYRVYDVTPGGSSVPFTNEFIRTLTSGKELALAFGNSFYLLSHRGASGDTPQFFTMDNLRLNSLDKSQSYSVSVTGNEAVFRVPEGIIKVQLSLQPGSNEIIFRTTTALESLTPESFLAASEYSRVLTAANRVDLGLVQLDLCNEQLYGTTSEANVCLSWSVPAAGVSNLVLGVSTPQLLAVGSDHYLLEVNGLTGANKIVVIRKIININNPRTSIIIPREAIHTEANWMAFIANITANRGPIFNVSGTLYLPAGNSPLLNQQFVFREYPVGVSYNLRDVRQSSAITANGSLVLGKDVLTITQGITGDLRNRRVNAQFVLQPYYYLSDDGTPLLLNFNSTSATTNNLLFILAIGSRFYDLSLTVQSPELVQVSLQERQALEISSPSKFLIRNRLFAEGNTRMIRIGAHRFEIKIDKIQRDETSPTRVNYVYLKVTKR